MAQITVGLDFGTHQTKLCIEHKEGAELGYSFFKFPDIGMSLKFTMPSIIQINSNGLLEYGYVNKNVGSRIIRYFKQATFATAKSDLTKQDAMLYSIWYIAYILFALEEEYGQEFTIQMGVPADGAHLDAQRQLAVSILLSAYNLVEDVFESDKDKFLRTPLEELKEKTTIIGYSKSRKEEYGILVFPEAYACLMPLVSTSKISGGMSLMVDIGGGTTDISFFSIEEDKKNPKNNKLRVYDFKSINKGLNFLSSSSLLSDEERTDSNVKSATDLQQTSINIFKSELNNICSSLRGRLYKEFKTQGDLPDESFEKALNNRPIVYTGGGSSFVSLRHGYLGFKDVIHISHKNWISSDIEELSIIVSLGLCPILSTAYGLAISRPNDKIICEPFRDIFSGIRQTKGMRKTEHPKKPKKVFGHDIGGSHGFNYMDDWDAWK